MSAGQPSSAVAAVGDARLPVTSRRAGTARRTVRQPRRVDWCRVRGPRAPGSLSGVHETEALRQMQESTLIVPGPARGDLRRGIGRIVAASLLVAFAFLPSARAQTTSLDTALATLQNADADTSLRRQAAIAAGRSGDRRATPALVTALKDASADVREEAAVALLRIGDPSAVQPLLAACRTSLS